ncbi:MAG: hypothetical protein Q9191_001109 [Dirinaria sp. TL-2023a]
MLWRQLRDCLRFLQTNKYPHIPNPPSCKKRASVALIIRFRPPLAVPAVFDSKSCGPSLPSATERLENFFAQQWVQQGEPEILFIKRASRAGDRWTSHVAFPGGGREPGDEDDCAASVRETREEIGLDLITDHCITIGNLPEQLVTTWWSKQPTFERSDVSDRFFPRGNHVMKSILRVMVGQLLFTARRLVPTESTYSRSISNYAPPNAQALSQRSNPVHKLNRIWQGSETLVSYKEPPLILWGLTYGILANFLGLMPSDDQTKMWDWPTLSSWDVRLVIWLTTYKFRASKMRKLINPASAAGQIKEPQVGASLDSMDNSTFTASDATSVQNKRPTSLDTVGDMLDGYFERLRIAIWIALALRVSASTITALLLFRRYRNRGQRAHL